MNPAPRPRILLLDDDPFMLRLLARMLTNLGHPQPTLCGEARTALEWVDHPGARPELILCDLNMPDMDGVEFVRALAERHYDGSLILVSGEEERILRSAEKLVRAHCITVLGHLPKPIAPDQLAAMVGQWRPPEEAPRRRPERPSYGAEEVAAAIAQGELVNFYQPKVALATRRVVGVESLVRWQHPRDGLVYPDQFIGVAEAHALIDDLTWAVLANALAQAKTWREAGLPLRVAVNVSMENLASLGFVDAAAALLAKAGVPAQSVVLEVTESQLMGDQRIPLEVLNRLRLKRFHLSIDDFGTGHSSLSQLRDVPFDELKIDQSFVHGAWADETLRAIYEGSLGMANQLGMEVVAEGAEDQADWDFLCQTGCHLAQGYFIARPMPGAEIPAWIAAWHARHGVAPESSPGPQEVR